MGSLSPETGPHLPAAILSLASRCSSASFGASRFLQPPVSQLDPNACICLSPVGSRA